jgi:hypothetical protein
MRLLPDKTTTGAVSTVDEDAPRRGSKGTASAGGRSAKAIPGLAYLFDDEKKKKGGKEGEGGEEGKEGARRRRRGPAKERKKARRINYELLSQPEGLPALYDRFKSGFKIDESLPLVRWPFQSTTGLHYYSTFFQFN